MPAEWSDQLEPDASEHGSLNALVSHGLDQKGVTIDDILDYFPNFGEDAEESEQVFETLEDSDIEILLDDDGSPEAPASPKRTPEDDKIDELIATDNTLGIFLHEMNEIPLLTKKEEVMLAKRMERGNLASKELGQQTADPRKHQVLEAVIRDGTAAYQHLIAANSRLVVSVAKRHRTPFAPFEDLVSEGHLGLIRGTKKFDYRRGYKFSTYVTWWIRQSISRYIADNGRTIRIPVHLGDQINRMNRVTNQLRNELGRHPTPEEIAEALGKSPQDVNQLIKYAHNTLSLDMPAKTDDGTDVSLGEFVEDDSSPDPEDSAESSLLAEYVQEALTTLSYRERMVMKMRHGLNDYPVYTLDQIGKKLGVTRERARQIEAQAARKLRNWAMLKSSSGRLTR